MKKILLAALCAFVATTASAQHLDYLSFRMTDGTVKDLPADGLKITFGNGQLHAAAASFKADFALAELSSMTFSAEATAVEQLSAARETVTIEHGRLVVKAPAGAAVEVYRMDGRQVDAHSQLQGAYIVKVNGRTYKLIAR